MVADLDQHRHPRLRKLVIATSALVCCVRGLGYTGRSPSSASSQYVSFLDTVVPLPVWAAVWIITSVVILLGLRWPSFARWGMSTFGILLLSWCSSYMFAWVFLDSSRAWMTASLLLLGGVNTIVLMFLMEHRVVRTRPKGTPDSFYEELDKGAENNRAAAARDNEE